jgi:hypothetical protein
MAWEGVFIRPPITVTSLVLPSDGSQPKLSRLTTTIPPENDGVGDNYHLDTPEVEGVLAERLPPPADPR